MRHVKSEPASRNEETYIFYTCLILVLAIAAVNMIIDITGR